ncbi:MAG: AMP-binding protein, partial [Bacteroidota bacterium]
AWTDYTWKEVGVRARQILSALQLQGIKRGERVALLSANCAEWIIYDLALMMGGYVSVPLYANVNAKSTAAMLAELYEVKGMEEKALFYQKKYVALGDTIFRESDLRKNRDLMIKIETIEAANEVEILRSQLELKELKQASLIRLIVSSIIILFLIVWFYFYRQRVKRRQLSMDLQKQQLELDKKNSELQLQTLHMARHTNMMNELEEGLKKLVSNNEGENKPIQRLINAIKIGRNMDKEWEKFDSYFSDVHKGFIDQLKVKFSSLTVNDIRLCTLLRMKLSNSEIATIMNIETKSIITAKYRLRKKLGLDKKEDLISFLHEVE